MIDRRVRKLAKYISKYRMSSIASIEKTLGFTRRQIDYAIQKINEVFESQSISVIKIANQELLISDEQQQGLLLILNNESSLFKYIYDSKERSLFILLMIISNYYDYLSMNDLIDALSVGKTTIINDIKHLDQELQQEGLTIEYNRSQGYFIQGEELLIRRYLIKRIMEDISQDELTVYIDFLQKYRSFELNQLRQKISLKMANYQINFVENRFIEFIYFLYILLDRLKAQKYKENDHMSAAIIKKTNEYLFAKDLLEELEIYDEREYLFLASWLLGQSIGNKETWTADNYLISELVERIITRFEAIAGIRFKDKTAVLNQLYSHFRPTYYRLLFKWPIINNMTDRIRKEYSHLFYIVKEIMEPISIVFNGKIPDDEIAFLTIHFASIVEGNVTNETSPSHRAIVVCPGGVGSSAIVLAELKSIFTEIKFIGNIDFQEVFNMDQNLYDIIFSTIQTEPLYRLGKPVFVVNPIMTLEEKYALLRLVYSQLGEKTTRGITLDTVIEIINRYAQIDNELALRQDLSKYLVDTLDVSIPKITSLRLSQLIKSDFIQINVEASNWEEAVRIAGEPLIKDDKIRSDYIDAIVKLDETNIHHMLITEDIALPHTHPEKGVNELAIGLTILKQPIDIGHKKIKVLFLLAAKDSNSHINAISDLLKLITWEKFSNFFEVDRSVAEVITLLNENENRNDQMEEL